jgi:hypothetical protein
VERDYVYDVGFGGYELSMSAGMEQELASRVHLGPFLGYSWGRFVRKRWECRGDCGRDGEASEPIDRRALHSWLTFGVRGRFELFRGR